MVDKNLSALFGSLLLLAAAMPLTTAHLSDTGSYTSGLFTSNDDHGANGPDFCRWEGNPGLYRTTDATIDYVTGTLDTPNDFDGGCAGSSGVSGSYINDPSNVFITGGDVFPLTIGVPVVGPAAIFPLGYFSSASALCDLEVLGDGSGHDPLDEKKVDSDPHPNGAIFTDGTWDDGGIGGACHTEDQYAHAEYNSPGCGIGGTHVIAEDKVSGDSVWIGASCDQGTDEGAGDGLILCLVNEIISGADPGELNDCINEFQGGTPVEPTFTCGSDGIADTISYGPGGGDLTPVGIPLVGLAACSGGSSAVFTFNYVSVGGNPNHRGNGDPTVVPATAGWIDSRNLMDWDDEYGPGVNIPNTECNDGVDSDGDTFTDEDDPECTIDVGFGPVYNPFDDDESA